MTPRIGSDGAFKAPCPEGQTHRGGLLESPRRPLSDGSRHFDQILPVGGSDGFTNKNVTSGLKNILRVHKNLKVGV